MRAKTFSDDIITTGISLNFDEPCQNMVSENVSIKKMQGDDV